MLNPNRKADVHRDPSVCSEVATANAAQVKILDCGDIITISISHIITVMQYFDDRLENGVHSSGLWSHKEP